MRKLWAFGDSYTFGHELSDCDDRLPSQLTYSALLAKELNCEYICNALGYYANNAIARTVIENINNIEKNDLVTVMWTYPIRREFMLIDGLSTIGRLEDHEFAKYYIKYADLDSMWMLTQSLRDIFLTQELLRNHQYIFLSAVTDLNKAIVTCDDRINLTDQINKQNWVDLDQSLGFHEWSEMMLNTTFLGHPTDQAHRLLADRIRNHYNE